MEIHVVQFQIEFYYRPGHQRENQVGQEIDKGMHYHSFINMKEPEFSFYLDSQFLKINEFVEIDELR